MSPILTGMRWPTKWLMMEHFLSCDATLSLSNPVSGLLCFPTTDATPSFKFSLFRSRKRDETLNELLCTTNEEQGQHSFIFNQLIGHTEAGVPDASFIQGQMLSGQIHSNGGGALGSLSECNSRKQP